LLNRFFFFFDLFLLNVKVGMSGKEALVIFGSKL